MVCSIGRLYNKAKDYASDNHYSHNQGLAQSYWFGKGAITLGLDGSVSLEGYNNAHQGLDNHGRSKRQRQSGKKYNPGRDITLSAPKSVSLLGLVKEDKAVIEAHQQAVKTTLDYIEQNCIFTRTGKGGINHIQTDNALFAVFQHDDNRNNDPQLHSHCDVNTRDRMAVRKDKIQNSKSNKLYLCYKQGISHNLCLMGYILR